MCANDTVVTDVVTEFLCLLASQHVLDTRPFIYIIYIYIKLTVSNTEI